MSEEPEEVLPQKWRAAAMVDDAPVDDETGGDEEAGTEVAVADEKEYGGEESGEGGQGESGGDEPRPHGERQTHHGHAASATFEGCGNQVDGLEDLGEAEDADAGKPEIHACREPGT